MVKCIIVEDEVLAQQVIQSHLKKIDSFELTAVCNNVPEAMEVLSEQDIDVMFLDIQLPGMTGLNFLRSANVLPLVVLTTAYGEHALESYELNVVDYLLKPISFERFSKAINKIIEGKLIPRTGKDSPDHIFVKTEGRFLKLNFSDIKYVEGLRDYLKIHTQDQTIVIHHTLGDMERILPPKQFMRVHKSYLVALAQIKSIYGNTIEIEKTSIPIGVNYKERVMGLIGRK